MEVKNVSELKRILQNNKVIIYGAGYVADKFYQFLRDNNLSNKVLYFVTTTGNDEKKYGRSVISVNELKKEENTVICIAVHEAIKDEIIKILIQKKVDNYVWIYPFQYELVLGEPIATGVDVPVSELMKTCLDDYRMAVRYLVLDNYFGKSTIGYETYTAVMSLYCGKETAEKRLHQFCNVISSWIMNGFDSNRCPWIFENHEVIDGAHRIAIASYLGKKNLKCNVYKKTRNLSEIVSPEALSLKSVVLDAGLTTEMLTALEERRQSLEEQYK